MNLSVLITAAVAAGGEHPLIDLDGTIFIQFGLFLVMAFFATQWLFKPYLRMREERSKGIEGAREEAAALSAEADARMADYQSKLDKARAKAYEKQREIRAEAAEHKREVTEKARAAAAKALEDAQAKVSAEAESARAELMPRASVIAQEITTKLLGRKVA